jgi:ketosteroid isomerase-like protein
MNDVLDLKTLATQYFAAFSNQDLEKLSAVYADNVTLRDWDIDVRGKNAVLAANQNIFRAVDSLEIVPLNMYRDGSTVASEIEIIINNKDTLKVVDVIDFDGVGKILNIRAYKG